jgi:integrase
MRHSNWLDQMASIIKRSYKAKLPDGSVEIRELDHWTIQFRDDAGKIKRIQGYRDKGATKQLAAKLEQARARGETGLVDPFKPHLARPIGEHVEEYLADLKAAGRDEKYRGNIGRRLRVIIDGAGWASLRDVEPNSFMQWRNKAKAEPRRGTRAREDGQAAARTMNQYLETFRAFTNWCAKMGRVPGVPIGGGRVIATALAGVGKVDGPTVRRRRALTDDQVTKLLKVAPADRALVYRVALAVGLRRGELEDLQWGDLKLDAAAPFIALRVEATKAGRADRVTLPGTLAVALRASKPASATNASPVFVVVPSLDLWKEDLAAAGIEYLDAQGRQVDFHGGTRKTLCTRMQRAGIPLATAMRTMRHTDARLTMVDYTDEEQLGVNEATAALPELVTAAKRTGRRRTSPPKR